MAIFCCKDCVAPKRQPGCHANCPEYIAEKAEHDRLKAEHDRKRDIESAVYFSRLNKVKKALRGHRKF